MKRVDSLEWYRAVGQFNCGGSVALGVQAALAGHVAPGVCMILGGLIGFCLLFPGLVR